MTIEERAKQLSIYMDGDLRVRDANIEMACVEIATEQDRIARQEEREECVRAAPGTACTPTNRQRTSVTNTNNQKTYENETK